MEKILLSRAEAAATLGLSLRSIDYLLSARKLAAKKVGRRTLVTRASLEKFCKSDRQVALTESSAGAE